MDERLVEHAPVLPRPTWLATVAVVNGGFGAYGSSHDTQLPSVEGDQERRPALREG